MDDAFERELDVCPRAVARTARDGEDVRFTRDGLINLCCNARPTIAVSNSSSSLGAHDGCSAPRPARNARVIDRLGLSSAGR